MPDKRRYEDAFEDEPMRGPPLRVCMPCLPESTERSEENRESISCSARSLCRRFC